MSNLLEIFRKNDIGEPPWEYDFLVNLPESEYPKYLAKIFNYRTGEKLPLKFDFKTKGWIIDKNRCKTFNQKIQWLKLYGVTDLMRMCTDKVAVRDYVKEKIGEEYLKPVLQIIPENNTNKSDVIANHNSILSGEAIQEERSQIAMNKNVEDKQLKSGLDCHVAIAPRNDGKTNDVSTYFDKIQWDKLPNAFVMKCNHGSKWQYIIKDKEDVLNTKPVVDLIRRNMTGWLEQEFFPWEGFEMQYKGIESKILIEPLMREEINLPVREIEVFCFNGKPKIFLNVRYGNQREISYYDENFNQIDLILHPDGNNLIIHEKADDYINQTFDLSIRLSKDLNFVRCDWIVFNNKLYFNEMTFTPYSGLIEFDRNWNKEIGSWINIGETYEF